MKNNKWIGAVLVVLIFVVGILLGTVLMHKQPNEPEDLSADTSMSQEESSESESTASASDPKEESSKPESESESESKVEEDSSKEPESQPEVSSSTETAVGPQGENVVRGIIVDATMNSVLVKENETGREIDFSKDTADVSGRIVVDAEVEVYYTGEIKGSDASEVFVTRIVSKA